MRTHTLCGSLPGLCKRDYCRCTKGSVSNMKKHDIRIWVITWLSLAAFSATQAATTGFRDDGAGLYPKAQPPLAWSASSNVVWKTALTNWSNASPVLSGKRLFVCAEPATMICVGADKGDILWMDTLPELPAPPPKTHGANGYTSPTPCTDGTRIWAVFGQGYAACWTVKGERLWTTKLEYPPHNWGGCISPRLAGGVLVVQFDNMIGLDPATGAEKWRLKTPWGWGSPVVATIAGKEVLYTCKGAVVDPASGREYNKGLVELAFNSPCLVDKTLYYLQGKPQAYALPANPEELPRPLWENTSIAEDRYYATPLVTKGLVYAINQARNLSVLDQATGKLVYQQKMGFLQGTVYPSPTLAGDYVFLSSENGQTVVIKAGHQYEEIARNTLEPFRSCPVFSGTRMYVRTLKHLWCIGK